MSKINFALRIIQKCAGPQALKSIYYAHFQSIMSYGIEFWGHAAYYLLLRVFKLQKQAIRLLAGVGPIESCRKLFPALEILPLPALYISHILIFFKNNPQYLNHAKISHNYETRHKNNNLVLSKHKTKAFENGAIYAGQTFYNKLRKKKNY